ncbi:MAG: hypothetical protein ABJA82_15765 [Myxococcales bacterium]
MAGPSAVSFPGGSAWQLGAAAADSAVAAGGGGGGGGTMCGLILLFDASTPDASDPLE